MLVGWVPLHFMRYHGADCSMVIMHKGLYQWPVTYIPKATQNFIIVCTNPISGHGKTHVASSTKYEETEAKQVSTNLQPRVLQRLDNVVAASELDL